jgi:hypothetical protein
VRKKSKIQFFYELTCLLESKKIAPEHFYEGATLSLEERALVKEFFFDPKSKALRSVQDVKAYFEHQHPKIGKKLNIRTLEHWKGKIIKNLKGIPKPLPKRQGRANVLPKELEDKLSDEILKQGTVGVPLNTTLLQPFIMEFIRHEGLVFLFTLRLIGINIYWILQIRGISEFQRLGYEIFFADISLQFEKEVMIHKSYQKIGRNLL